MITLGHDCHIEHFHDSVTSKPSLMSRAFEPTTYHQHSFEMTARMWKPTTQQRCGKKILCISIKFDKIQHLIVEVLELAGETNERIGFP